MESTAVGELSPQPQAHSTANDVCIALQREKETLERKLQTLEQEVKKREAVFVQEQSILNRRIKDFEEKEKKDKESKEKLLNLVSRSEEQQQRAIQQHVDKLKAENAEQINNLREKLEAAVQAKQSSLEEAQIRESRDKQRIEDLLSRLGHAEAEAAAFKATNVELSKKIEQESNTARVEAPTESSNTYIRELERQHNDKVTKLITHYEKKLTATKLMHQNEKSEVIAEKQRQEDRKFIKDNSQLESLKEENSLIKSKLRMNTNELHQSHQTTLDLQTQITLLKEKCNTLESENEDFRRQMEAVHLVHQQPLSVVGEHHGTNSVTPIKYTVSTTGPAPAVSDTPAQHDKRFDKVEKALDFVGQSSFLLGIPPPVNLVGQSRDFLYEKFKLAESYSSVPSRVYTSTQNKALKQNYGLSCSRQTDEGNVLLNYNSAASSKQAAEVIAEEYSTETVPVGRDDVEDVNRFGYQNNGYSYQNQNSTKSREYFHYSRDTPEGTLKIAGIDAVPDINYEPKKVSFFHPEKENLGPMNSSEAQMYNKPSSRSQDKPNPFRFATSEQPSSYMHKPTIPLHAQEVSSGRRNPSEIQSHRTPQTESAISSRQRPAQSIQPSRQLPQSEAQPTAPKARTALESQVCSLISKIEQRQQQARQARQANEYHSRSRSPIGSVGNGDSYSGFLQQNYNPSVNRDYNNFGHPDLSRRDISPIPNLSEKRRVDPYLNSQYGSNAPQQSNGSGISTPNSDWRGLRPVLSSRGQDRGYANFLRDNKHNPGSFLLEDD